MGWMCDPDLNDTLEASLDKGDWAYVAVIDRTDLERGDVQLGRHPTPDDSDDDPPDDRKERALAWLRGRVNQRIAVADRKTMLKLRVRGYGPKGISSVFSHTFTLSFEGERATESRSDTPLANEARELVGVMLDGMRGVVSTASSLMSQMGSQLLDERRQQADLHRAVASYENEKNHLDTRKHLASEFTGTARQAIQAIAGAAHPVLSNPKVRALLERPEVIDALKDDAMLDELAGAVSMLAKARQHAIRPSSPPPPSPASEAARRFEALLAQHADLATLLNTKDGEEALQETLRHLAATTHPPEEETHEPVPA